MNGRRAFYALYERGVPVEMQYYPLARRAFDFRGDQSPEEKIAEKRARDGQVVAAKAYEAGQKRSLPQSCENRAVSQLSLRAIKLSFAKLTRQNKMMIDPAADACERICRD